MEDTIFSQSLMEMKHVKSSEGKIQTMPFLNVCRSILPLLDKFGGLMSFVRSDIGSNINRLEKRYISNPSKYGNLYSIVEEEVGRKSAISTSSCTNGLVWLTRSMDFLIEVCRGFNAHPDWPMSKVYLDSYAKTLKKWHGWLSSSTFSVALKVAPDRNEFQQAIGGTKGMVEFCNTLSPFLEENHKFLESVGCDNIKAA